MSKNKIIFSILWFLVLLFVIFLILVINWKNERNKNPATNNDFTIWILNDDEKIFSDYLENFKSQSENYKKTKFNIISFDSYIDYYNSLIWAFLNDNWPDLFVLNNNEAKIFDNKIMWIDPSIINPDTFRNNYEIVFSNDLIESWEVNWKNVEYLRWIPLWYESLWLFYNFRELRWKELSTWWYINDAISELNWDRTSVIWIWNGSTVKDASDIITQFFVQDWYKSLNEVTWSNAKNSLWRYFLFWDPKLSNKYDLHFQELQTTWKNNVDKFSDWDLQMIIGYPSLIKEISQKWFNKSFLRASPFPSFNKNTWNILVNYNYFVVNKNTKDYDLSMELLKYFNSENWQKKYLELFDYYMPSMLSLVSERLEQSINKDYTIKYKDFYNLDYDLTSFNKWNKYLYDTKIINILDNSSNYKDLFENFRKTILCIWNKMLKQENMSTSCNSL